MHKIWEIFAKIIDYADMGQVSVQTIYNLFVAYDRSVVHRFVMDRACASQLVVWVNRKCPPENLDHRLHAPLLE